jgi:apolipoprotein N-acyltransferase
MKIMSKNHLIAVVAGASAVLGFAPFYLFHLSILSLAVLFYLWIKSPTPKTASLLGFSYGLGLYCTGIYWIYISLHDYGGMPWWFAGFCTFCLCAFMALFPALVGWGSKRMGMLWLTAPVLWGVSDWVRSWIFTGFPWLTMGYSQVPNSPLTGWMPVFGVYGVSTLAALLAALLAGIIARQQMPATCKRGMAVIALIVLFGGIGLRQVAWVSPIGNPISVSLLQGNIPQDIKWSPEAAESSIARYLNMTRASHAQLIVLPETAMPVVASQLDPRVTEMMAAHAKQNGGDLLVGMVEYNEKSGQYYNSALSYGSAPTQAYRKNHLVPFGEFIPLKQVFGWIYRDWLNMPLSDLSRVGWDQTPMPLAGQQVAVNICYEDVFGEEIIRQLPQATLLVNMSNDAWYGRSIAADQHMQFSQARAIETGRMVLRATNTGATAAIDANGNVVAHVPHDTQISLNTTAQGYTGMTPYASWGNWPFLALSLIGLIFVLSRKTK